MNFRKAILFLFFLSHSLCATEWPIVPDVTEEEIASYFLAEDHEMKPILDLLFQDRSVLKSNSSLKKAGFKVLHDRPSSMIIVSHPLLKGHLVKLHLNDSRRTKEQIWGNFVKRCKGADNIRKMIKEENIKFFTVADKWLYFPPFEEAAPLLLVTDMEVYERNESREAWKTKITRKHIREVYSIIRRGLASTSLPSNTPYTKNGNFAFVDTESPFRYPMYNHARKHLSPEMQLYWDTLRKGDTGAVKDAHD